jgi:acid phosphatase (class A)
LSGLPDLIYARNVTQLLLVQTIAPLAGCSILKTPFSLLTLVLCVGLIGGFAQATDTDTTTKWLSAADVQALEATVPPPPATDDADLAILEKIQSARTDAMVAECKRDQKFADTLFQSVYGTNLTPATSPKFYALMKNVLQITKVVNENVKDKYKRLRPYQAHPDKIHSLFTVDGFSYPSGHSMGSFTLAVVLGAVFPDKAQAFLDRAAQIAQSRVDAGVHNPSDIAEGEVLGKATGAAIIANAAFQKDFADVQAEVKK